MAKSTPEALQASGRWAELNKSGAGNDGRKKTVLKAWLIRQGVDETMCDGECALMHVLCAAASHNIA